MTDDSEQTVHPSMDKEPRIDGLEIVEPLGCGGTSSVWKARQISLQRFVVVKVLASHFVRNDEDIKQFRMEAQIAANLKHNGIVQVYDFGQSQDDGRYYFVMEYISGYSIGQWLFRKGILPEKDALVVVHSVASALAYAWEKSGIVHCDIKPDNIMVDGDGTIKVTDLGLAQVVHNIGYDSNQAGDFVMGTPNYMSPEQMRGTEKLDCRSDIYSLGMTLYHMVTGVLPFASDTPMEVMEKQLHDDLEHPQRVNQDVSPAVAHLIMRMTAKNPLVRCQNWEEVMETVRSAEKKLDAPAAAVDQPAVKPPADVHCPQCNALLRANALFCGKCGHRLNEPESAKVKLRVRPLSELKPPPPAPGRLLQRPARFAPRTAKSGRGRFFSSLTANLRLVISVGLLLFMGFYFYKKHQGVDIMIPVRARLHRAIVVNWRQARQHVAELWPWGSPDDDAPAVTPPTDSVSPAPPPARRPAAPPPPVQASAPPARPTPPAADSARTERPEAHPDYERLLELCRNEQPQPGDRIAVKLRHQSEPREGILREVGSDGISMEIDSGEINLPFDVMTPEYRLRFFPERRARMLLRQRER